MNIAQPESDRYFTISSFIVFLCYFTGCISGWSDKKVDRPKAEHGKGAIPRPHGRKIRPSLPSRTIVVANDQLPYTFHDWMPVDVVAFAVTFKRIRFVDTGVNVVVLY